MGIFLARNKGGEEASSTRSYIFEHHYIKFKSAHGYDKISIPASFVLSSLAPPAHSLSIPR